MKKFVFATLAFATAPIPPPHKSYDKAVDYASKAQTPSSNHRNGCDGTERSPPQNESSRLRREIMKTMLLAAAALSFGIGSAYAAQGPADGYVYPDYITPGSVYAGAPTSVQTTPATAQNGRAVHTYVTHSQSQSGIWLFPPNQAGGGSN
jgi:hypothetical protein